MSSGKTVSRQPETKKRADYIRKKSTIQFTGYACHYRYYSNICDSWTLSGGMKHILKGLAHFEDVGNFDRTFLIRAVG